MNILLDANDDIFVQENTLPLVSGLDEMAQMSRLRLQAFEGDWFLNLDAGMPYFQEILKRSTSLTQIESLYLQEIGSIPGIMDIQEFNLALDTDTPRKLNITFSALTTDGVLDFTGGI